MDLLRIGWSGGVGVATTLLGPLVPVAGAAAGFLINKDPLFNGSLALLGRWVVHRFEAVPIPPGCPPIEVPKDPIPKPPPNITSGLYQHWLNAPITTPRKTLI
jgi:hypothetical protein